MMNVNKSSNLLSVTLNVLKFIALFIFFSQMKCSLSGPKFTYFL